MDLSNFDSSHIEADLTLRHPVTGEPLSDDDGAATIRLRCVDHEVVQKAARKRLAESLEITKKDPAKSLEVSYKNIIENLVSATVSWEKIQLEGEVLEYSEDNARKLYRRFPWIREQVDAFMSDRANFFKASPEN